MPDIMTVTLNPAVDVAAVGTVAPTKKLRCGSPARYPSGGGINVARVIHRLGGDCVAVYLAGGGNRRTAHVHAEPRERAVHAHRHTRRDAREIYFREGATGLAFRFVLPGPEVVHR